MQTALASDTISCEELVNRFQKGDSHALASLWERHRPHLTRWTRQRLPAQIRGTACPDDLVQDAFVRSMPALRRLKVRRPESVRAYLRTIVLNEIRDYARQQARRLIREYVDPDFYATRAPSPLDELLTREVFERYERALDALRERDRELVVAVVESGYSDRELVRLFGKNTKNGARMARTRALSRLREAMRPECFGRRDSPPS